MSDDIRLVVNEIKSNHSSESPTIINNHDLIMAGDEKLLYELGKVEMNRSNTTHEPTDKEKPPLTKIQRILEIMLQQYKSFDKSNYKPRYLSIGPIHANSDNLMKRELKIKLAARFVEKSGKTSEELLREIKANVVELRKSFDEQVVQSYDDDSLSRLLFLDGCSMLQFFWSYFSDNLKDFKITNGEVELIQHDLLLAENQIPFLVLKLLIDSGDDDEITGKMLKISVMNFVLANAPIGFGYSKIPRNFFDLIDAQDRVHLLDLLRAVLLFGDQNIGEDDIDQREKFISHLTMERIFGDRGIFFMHLFFNPDPITILQQMFRNNELYPKWSFRNVQELKLAGIKLKPSALCSLKAISFTTKFFIAGQLELPTLIVDNSTASKLLNLVAYEMCLHDYKTNCMVTSYINFLDLLIDSEQDVKDLRAACILRNRLSSDAEVAKLFNSIGYDCLMAPKDFYSKVKNEIEKHYQRKIVIWMAQVYNDQFKTPWTVIALLAAAIALILTAIQTWCAVHPNKN